MRENIATHWNRIGSKLVRIRRRELREFDHAKYRASIDALLDIGFKYTRPRTTSGLIELQRILAKGGRYHPARQARMTSDRSVVEAQQIAREVAMRFDIFQCDKCAAAIARR